MVVRAVLAKKILTQGLEIREGVCPVASGGKELKAEGIASTKALGGALSGSLRDIREARVE